MFKITHHKGFHITFENGWTISVQFGGGNYCENYDVKIGSEYLIETLTSKDAEIAAWDIKGNWFVFENGDTVRDRVNANELLGFMNKFANMGK
jgi:hypothetical protein